MAWIFCADNLCDLVDTAHVSNATARLWFRRRFACISLTWELFKKIALLTFQRCQFAEFEAYTGQQDEEHICMGRSDVYEVEGFVYFQLS